MRSNTRMITTFAALLVAGILVLTSCAQGPSDTSGGNELPQTGGEAVVDDTSSGIVPESERAVPDGTVAVIYPAYVTAASGGAQAFVAGDSPEEAAEKGDASYDSGGYANEDGTATVYYTPEQREAHEERMLARVDEFVSSGVEGIAVEVSTDLRHVTVSAGREANPADVQHAMFMTSSYVAAAQVMRTLGEDFSITVEAVDASTGEVMESYDQDTYSSWSSDFAWLGGSDE